MFEDEKCPMLMTDVIYKYNLSDNFIKGFCGLGCSTKCGGFLKEELEKRGML